MSTPNGEICRSTRRRAEPVEQVGQERTDREGEQDAEAHEDVQRAEDAAPQLVVDALVEEREAEHVDRSGAHPEDRDEAAPRGAGRTSTPPRSATRPATNTDAGEHLRLGQTALEDREHTTPRATPQPSAKMKKPKPVGAGVEHPVGEHRTERHEHAAADQARWRGRRSRPARPG